MNLELLPFEFTVCQAVSDAAVDLRAPFTFFARTDEEISLVCPSDACPKETAARRDGWRCLRVAGTLDFSLVGILAQIAHCLAAAKVPIFAVSTYNTDYVLFEKAHTENALNALREAGFTVAFKG